MVWVAARSLWGLCSRLSYVAELWSLVASAVGNLVRLLENVARSSDALSGRLVVMFGPPCWKFVATLLHNGLLQPLQLQLGV